MLTGLGRVNAVARAGSDPDPCRLKTFETCAAPALVAPSYSALMIFEQQITRNDKLHERRDTFYPNARWQRNAAQQLSSHVLSMFSVPRRMDIFKVRLSICIDGPNHNPRHVR